MIKVGSLSKELGDLKKAQDETVARISPEIVNGVYWWVVSFPFSWDAVAVIKKIPRAHFDRDRKAWFVPTGHEDALAEFLQFLESRKGS